MIVLVMGVSGAGKTTVGTRTARLLRCPFVDADDLHSAANREKMRSGHPLTDEDRSSWLASVHQAMLERSRGHADLVVACSALKKSYRDQLIAGLRDVLVVYLKLDPELARRRVANRPGHFFPDELVPTQFEILEEPGDAFVLDAGMTPERLSLAIGKEVEIRRLRALRHT
ncbi:MAG: gluconokinase [Verrucomicrobiae bacterium]|nr:gluconokinase [Verrucomicrobiae bacterium]